MSYFTPISVNAVFLITSPRTDEEGVTRRLIESISDASNNGGCFNFTHASIYRGDGYFQLMNEMYSEIDNGLKPIIHFDMHGCEARGLEIGATGEYIDWKSVVDSLRILNEKLQNELVVVITACHGLHTILPVTFEKTAPFLCLFAPEEEITVSDIEDKVPKFYHELFATESLESAFQKLGDKFKCFNSVEFLFKTLALYIRRECKGVGGRERREELLTQIMESPLGDASEKISEYRVNVKQYIKPDQALLDRYTSRFLMGKANDVRIEDLLAEIEKAQL